MNPRNPVLLASVGWLIATTATAQEGGQPANAEALAKQLANPVASLVSIPF